MEYKINVEDIESALVELGGEASTKAMQAEVFRKFCNDVLPGNYASRRTFNQTIQRIIENHCPQAVGKKSSHKSEKFLRISKGIYRLINTSQRPPIVSTAYNDEWTDEEISACVKAYLWMLDQEISGLPYSKTEVRKKLIAEELGGRTDGAIEYRMQNISATLDELCLPRIKGYLPAANIGKNIKDKIRSILDALGHISLQDYSSAPDDPTFEEKVKKLRQNPLVGTPRGIEKPQKSATTSNVFSRDPLVKAWALENAKGVCEACGCDAPFITSDGKPYLEVHHVRPLAQLGSDRVTNAVAVCPNCHRYLHLGSDRKNLYEQLYEKVERLIKEHVETDQGG